MRPSAIVIQSLLTIGAALLIPGPAAAQQVYQCRSESGTVTYTQTTPCGYGTRDATLPAAPAAAGASRLEPGASVVQVTPTQLEAFLALVTLSGYRCDTVSAARPCLYGCDYVVSCNGYRYSYDLTDRGGRMVVTVE